MYIEDISLVLYRVIRAEESIESVNLLDKVDEKWRSGWRERHRGISEVHTLRDEIDYILLRSETSVGVDIILIEAWR